MGIARLLTRGTDCTVVRSKKVAQIQRTATELYEYVDRSGGLQSSSWIHAWRNIFILTKSILEQSDGIEVHP